MQYTALSLSLLVPLLCSPAQGQSSNSSSSNSSSGFLQEAISGLQAAGFSGLAKTLYAINGTVPGEQLFAQLQSGKNFLLFAPDDTAVQNIQSSVSSNTSLLAEYISYHFVEGQFLNSSYTNSSAGGSGASTSASSQSSTQNPSASADAGLYGRLFKRQDGGDSGSSGNSTSGSNSSSSNPQPFAGVWPNVTIGRTLLNASEFAQLEGNKSQVLAWSRSTPDGNVTVLNQANITVLNGTMWNNILIQGINGTLIPPGNFSTALTAINATAAENLLSSIQVPAANGTNETALEACQEARGITFFVPNNAAFTSDVNTTISGLQNNTSEAMALLQNHYVNGTSLYSTEIDNSTLVTSAAGQYIQFLRNDTGLFVIGGNNSVAQIVRPDVLLSNGVAHIIDGVFFDTNNNTAVAQSAYASATSAAAVSTTETGPIAGAAGGASQTQSSDQSSSTSQSSSSTDSSTSQESTATASATATQSAVAGFRNLFGRRL